MESIKKYRKVLIILGIIIILIILGFFANDYLLGPQGYDSPDGPINY